MRSINLDLKSLKCIIFLMFQGLPQLSLVMCCYEIQALVLECPKYRDSRRDGNRDV